MILKLHASGEYNYLKALKEAYRILMSQVESNRHLPPSKKKAEIDRLKVEYDRKRKLAPYGLF
jgi:hypothetical protein